MPTSIEFSLRKVKTDFALIVDPTIPVELLTLNGFTPFDFLLDTGADATLLPRSMAKILGINLRELPKERMFGIESAGGVQAYRGKVTFRIAKHIFSATAFFSASDACPLILGRADFFDHFSVTFDNRHSKLILARIS